LFGVLVGALGLVIAVFMGEGMGWAAESRGWESRTREIWIQRTWH